MKLKKPITLTITNTAAVVAFAEMLHQPRSFYTERIIRLSEFSMQVTKNPSETVQKQIADQLTAQGIDYRTWEPPQPLKIASHEVTANPDGSIKVGCTDVSRAELVAAYELSTEAMQGEWPKWWRSPFGTLFSANSADDWGVIYDKSGNGFTPRTEKHGLKMEAHAKDCKLIPLTALEAARILEGKQ